MKKLSLAPSAFTEDHAESILSGTSTFQEHLRNLYLYNLISNTKQESAFAYHICDMAESNKCALDIDDKDTDLSAFPIKPKKAGAGFAYPSKRTPGPNEVDPRDWQYLKRKFAQQKPNKNAAPSNIETNMTMVADSIGLSQIEREVMTCLYVVGLDYKLNEAITELTKKNPARIVPLLARMLNRPKDLEAIAKVVNPNSALFTAGIMAGPEDYESDDIFPTIDPQIQELVALPVVSPDAIVERLIGKPFDAQLDLADFAHYEEALEHIVKIVKNAVEKGETGINILFSGPPGAGKTELAKALAAKLGLSLYGVGEQEPQDEEDHKKDTSKFRVSKLLQAHTFLKGNKKAILFFDEVEDLLLKGTDSSKKADTPNKIILNRLLEENPVVTIWAGNDIEKFHEAVRSRFVFDLHVSHPPTLVRKKIWTRQAEIKKTNMSDEDALNLARRFQAPPRMIANALKLASLNGSGVEDIIKYMQSASRLVYGSAKAIEPETVLSAKFTPDLIGLEPGAQEDFAHFIDATDAAAPTILLQGQAGSGIVSIASYMAERRVANLSAFDMRELLKESPTESPADKIRQAFSEAANSKDLLLITNADALAVNPASKSADWNANGLADVFMQCVYDAPVPMIVSSYRPDAEFPDLVTAGFVSHMRLRALDQTQRRAAGKLYLGREVDNLPDNVVPLDFSRAAKMKAKYGEMDDEALRKLVERQISTRRKAHGMGFHPNQNH